MNRTSFFPEQRLASTGSRDSPRRTGEQEKWRRLYWEGRTLKKRQIGSLEVSVVGLGGNNFGTDFFGPRCDVGDTARVVHAALDAGVNFIDTGESYGTPEVGARHSEECIGLALGSRRGEAVIATKFSNPSSRHPEQRLSDRIASAVEGSLRRLRTDWIDLYQHHHPDPSVPFEEVLEALDRLVRAGKVREVGCCNYSGAMIDAARTISLETGWTAFVTAQNGYSVLDPTPEAGVLDACANHGMFLLPHSPLASGVLTGKYRKGHSVPPDTRLAADTPIGERERAPTFRMDGSTPSSGSKRWPGTAATPCSS